MMDGVEPPTPPEEPVPRSSFEDFEIPEPVAAPPAHRPAVITTAALVLLVAGLMNILFVVLFRQAGSSAPLYVVMGGAQLITAVLLALMLPVGRQAAFVMGGLGAVLGFVQALGAPTGGLMSMALNGFVIYAAAATGPSFRRG